MAIFSNKLTPEESDSGFTTEETDNETFSLSSYGNTYPGKIQNYDESNFINNNNNPTAYTATNRTTATDLSIDNNSTEQIEQENVENIDEIVADNPLNNDELEYNVGNIADEHTFINEPIFNDEPLIKDEPISDAELMSNDDFNVEAVNNEAIPDRETIDGVNDITLDDVFNLNDDEDNANINTDSIKDADATIIANDDTQAEQRVETDEGFIEFDDDFKNLLMNDIKSSTNPNNDETNYNDIATNTDDVIKFGSTQKLEFDDSNDELSADLITMDIQTNRHTTEIQPDDKNIEPNNANEENFEFNIDPINNNKMSYANINNDNNNSADNISSEVKTNNNMENNNKTNSPNNKKTLALIISIVLLAAILIIGGIIGYLYLSQEPTHTAQNTEKEKKDESLAKKDSAITDTTKNIDTTKIDSNKIDTTKTDSIKVDAAQNKQNDTTTTPVNRRNINDNNTIANNNVKPRTNRPINTSPATREKKSNAISVIPKSDLNAVYTVQIYSSPSKEDAELRLNSLSQKNINGYISARTIKGDVWYRVRFGSYNSYEAAFDAAARYGFSNAWIERIK